MNQSIKTIKDSHFSFEINDKEKTASVIEIRENTFLSQNSDEIIIPQFIIYESDEYTVTSIKKNSYNNIYFTSTIPTINIPSTITDIEDGFISDSLFFKKIIISPNNPRYMSWDNCQLVLSKSNINQDNYDTLIFCQRNAEEVKIPDFIEIIGPYAFSNCSFISIEIPKKSKLRIIEKFAFTKSKITKFDIPQHLTTIKRGAFLLCNFLERLNFTNKKKSELNTIETDAFYGTKIKNFTIPFNLVNLEDGWCKNISIEKFIVDKENPKYFLYETFIISKSKENYHTLVYCLRNNNQTSITIPDFVERIGPYAFNYLEGVYNIEFSSESKLRIINEYAFANCKICTISFPKSLKCICENSFYQCKQLSSVNFEDNSELEEIGQNAFYQCIFNRFYLPSNVKKICKKAFFGCDHLTNFKIPIDSKLQTIESNAFDGSSIVKLYIPSNLTELKNDWCSKTTNLTCIEISPENKSYCLSQDKKMIFGKSSNNEQNNNNNNYDVLVFACRDLSQVQIPNFIQIIGESCFSFCKQLSDVQIQSDSKLRRIEKAAFLSSSLKKFVLPSHVTHICEQAFSSCGELEEFEIMPDSELKCIENHAFSYSFIKKIELPSQLEILRKQAFYYCQKLESVKFPSNPNFNKIDDYLFWGCSKLKNVQIPENSRLEIIGKNSFGYSGIENFTIPSHVTQICENAFYLCQSLQVEFPRDSNLQKIEYRAFYKSSIESAKIPRHVTFIGKSAFAKCDNLVNVDIPADSELQFADKGVFEVVYMKHVRIPLHLKEISDSMFSHCYELERVDIPDESEIQSIGCKAFTETAISSFKITKHVKFIGLFAFLWCECLQIIEIDENSELQYLEIDSLNSMAIIMIPAKVSDHLKIQEINE